VKVTALYCGFIFNVIQWVQSDIILINFYKRPVLKNYRLNEISKLNFHIVTQSRNS